LLLFLILFFVVYTVPAVKDAVGSALLRVYISIVVPNRLVAYLTKIVLMIGFAIDDVITLIAGIPILLLADFVNSTW
jgi:hypothetical protein